MIDLRCFIYLDVLQPQMAGFMQTVAPGNQPLEGMASLLVEVRPGISINQITDITLKNTDVKPGFQIVDRRSGVLEVHEFDQGQVRAAGETILDFYNIEKESRLEPRIITEQIITSVEGAQAMLINRMRHGDLLLERQTLYVLEVHPAGYAAIAANEAEKAADIQLLEVQFFGAFGRLYLGGDEASIEEAAAQIRMILGSIKGRPNKA